MNVAILGAGSLGCIIGGFLAEGGCDVTLIGRRKSHTDAISEDGLIITGIKGDHVVKVKATSNPLEVEDTDLLILVTKSLDTSAALDSVSHLYKRVKCAFSLQNGMAKDEHLMERFGRDGVIGGASTVSGAMVGDGRVECTNDGVTFLGEFDGNRTDRVSGIASMFDKAGLKVEVVDDIRSLEWTKVVHVAALMAISALTRLEIYKILKNRLLAGLNVQMVREGAAVAIKDGARLQDLPALGSIRSIVESGFDRAVAQVVEEGNRWEKAGMTHLTSSMLQSILRRKRTEVEETTGYIIKRGKELGVETPTLELCYRFIKGIEAYLE